MTGRRHENEPIHNPLVRDQGWLSSGLPNEELIVASKVIEGLWSQWKNNESDALTTLYEFYETYERHVEGIRDADIVGAFLIQSCDEFASEAGISPGVITSVEFYVRNKAKSGCL